MAPNSVVQADFTDHRERLTQLVDDPSECRRIAGRFPLDREDGTHFSVNIIPHTQAVTTLGALEAGQPVNIEIDVLARYLQRMEAYRGQA